MVTKNIPKPNRAVAALAAVACGVGVYAFGSLAIDSGSYWHYGLAVVCIVLAVRLAGRVVKP